MAQLALPEILRKDLVSYLSAESDRELVDTYLHFLELKHDLEPVLFIRDKMIFENVDKALSKLEKDGQLYHQAEIKIQFHTGDVNEETKRVYICPFTGKVFGDNTHPNPQDAIYDWVSKCKENTERSGGLKAKRFYVSEDPEVIKSYIPKEKPKEGVTKTVFSSLLSGRLFASKKGVLEEVKKNYFKPMSLFEVQNQNRFKIDDTFLAFLKENLQEEKIARFVEELAEYEEFSPFIEKWLA